MEKIDRHISAAYARWFQCFIAALTWAAKRTGPSTAALELSFKRYEGIPDGEAQTILVEAFSGAGHDQLENLTHLWIFFDFCYFEDAGAAAVLDWLLEHAVNLQALSLGGNSPHLAAGTITLKHLKHLVMRSYAFESEHFQAAKQLPALEDFLCINDIDSVNVIDVTGCCNLRLLTLCGSISASGRLLKDPACRFAFNPDVEPLRP